MKYQVDDEMDIRHIYGHKMDIRYIVTVIMTMCKVLFKLSHSSKGDRVHTHIYTTIITVK